MPIETFFSVPEQVGQFLVSVLLGGAMGVVFDIFRALRIVLPRLHNAAVTAAEDVVFWLLYGGAFYIFSLMMGRGQLRVYFFIGSLAGFLLYLVTVGKAVVFVFRGIATVLSKALHKVIRTVNILKVYLRKRIRQKQS